MLRRRNLLRLHRISGALALLPTLVILGSGLLLQLKKHWSWVQPPERRGTGRAPGVGLDGLLAALQGRPELGVQDWADIRRVDLRPERSLAKVLLPGDREVQVDLGEGRILSVAPRRSDMLESLHDGSLLGGQATKLGVHLPAGLALLVATLTGAALLFPRRGPSRGGAPPADLS